MDKIKISDIHSVVVYNRDDYFADNRKINSDCMSILLSHENNVRTTNLNEAREYLEDLNSNMYFDYLDAKIYVMYREKEPICFAIYNKIEKSESWVLDLIYTHDEWTKLGLATALLRVSAKDLKENYGAEEINATVNHKNLASVYLHQSFAKVNGVKVALDRMSNRDVYHFDIRDMKSQNQKQEAEELLF